jgi:hypothetical protein
VKKADSFASERRPTTAGGSATKEKRKKQTSIMSRPTKHRQGTKKAIDLKLGYNEEKSE